MLFAALAGVLARAFRFLAKSRHPALQYTLLERYGNWVPQTGQHADVGVLVGVMGRLLSVGWD
ncbi:hypothetical protein AIOL_004636 [Candidatus Rhodobacter oscarellae]|uniref:Uncharacterized protein n=1 Tax=Candidatus Rhodobacter oscarellae TaxID=1675527 RepID=A0A0J9ED55_9RHOB|nr:hypothetical protein AIOL_004636 [Candidatus Rhodobacter lobularis]